MKCIKYIFGFIAFIAFLMIIGTCGAADNMAYGAFVKKAVAWAVVFIISFSTAKIAYYCERE